jgi:hypothetical protein
MRSNFARFCIKILTSGLHFRNISYDKDKLLMLSLVTDLKGIPPDRKLQPKGEIELVTEKHNSFFYT